MTSPSVVTLASRAVVVVAPVDSVTTRTVASTLAPDVTSSVTPPSVVAHQASVVDKVDTEMTLPSVARQASVVVRADTETTLPSAPQARRPSRRHRPRRSPVRFIDGSQGASQAPGRGPEA